MADDGSTQNIFPIMTLTIFTASLTILVPVWTMSSVYQFMFDFWTSVFWQKESFCLVNQNLFLLLFSIKHRRVFTIFLDTFSGWMTFVSYATRKSFIYCLLALLSHHQHYNFILIVSGKVTTAPHTTAHTQKTVLCQNKRWKLIKTLIVAKTTRNRAFSTTEGVHKGPKCEFQFLLIHV